MAGTMVHLLVAQHLLDEIKRRGLRYCFNSTLVMKDDFFIAGNICPDGIMARKGYRREMKLHSHFRDDIPDGSFGDPGMVPLFEKRMQEFWQEHAEDERKMPGLYLGYITHMMVDERFILEERPKFFENIASIGLTKKDVETFIRFNTETDLVDFRLVREKLELQKARVALENVGPYEIEGMITEDELIQSRQWILTHFFEEMHPEKEAEFLQYDDMVEFAERVEKEIIQRLHHEGYLSPLAQRI